MISMMIMLYVNDEPESKFLYTETIRLYCCIVSIEYLFADSSAQFIPDQFSSVRDGVCTALW